MTTWLLAPLPPNSWRKLSASFLNLWSRIACKPFSVRMMNTISDTLPPTGLIDPLQFWCIKMPTMLTGSFGRSILPQADIPAHADALSAE